MLFYLQCRRHHPVRTVAATLGMGAHYECLQRADSIIGIHGVTERGLHAAHQSINGVLLHPAPDVCVNSKARQVRRVHCVGGRERWPAAALRSLPTDVAGSSYRLVVGGAGVAGGVGGGRRIL